MSITGIHIKDILPKPKIGQKVIITDYSFIPSNLAAKLSKKKYCEIIEIESIPIGENGDYHFEYEIYIQNGENFIFPPGTYKILTNDEIIKIDNFK
jgi:hypothetical protein